MINWTDTNLVWTQPRPILTSALALIAEGQGLVSAYEGGTLKATPGTGNNTDSFLGIAMGPRRTFGTSQMMESVVVPMQPPYTVLLKNLVSSAPGCYQTGGALVGSSNGAASGTNVSYATDPVSGLTLLTFDSSFAGTSWTVAYSFAMSIVQEEGLYGDANPGYSAEQKLAQVEVFLIGKISVSNWKPTANWFAGGGLPKVKLLAGGIWSDANDASPGVVPSKVNAVQLPSAANPNLILELV